MDVRALCQTNRFVASSLVVLIAALPLTVAHAAAITEYPLPTADSFPTMIASGADGNLWFLEDRAHQIGKITPGGTITEYPVPNVGNFSVELVGISTGPDGNMWFTGRYGNPEQGTASGTIGRITPDGSIMEFAPPSHDYPYSIAAGPDGNLWFAEAWANKIGRINKSGVVLDEFPVPTGKSLPNDIAAGADGNMWFTEFDGHQIGKITMAGTVTEYAIPANAYSPYGIAGGADGNVWFTEYGVGGAIGRITPDGTITEFDAGATPFGITRGLSGELWFTRGSSDPVAAITPQGTIGSSFHFEPWVDWDSVGNIVLGSDRNLWFTDIGNNSIGKAELVIFANGFEAR
jgi:streptogramin lyase